MAPKRASATWIALPFTTYTSFRVFLLMQSTRPFVRQRLSSRYLPTTALDDAAVAAFCGATTTWGATFGATVTASAVVVAESAPTPTNAAAVRVAPSLRRMPMFPCPSPNRVACTKTDVID